MIRTRTALWCALGLALAGCDQSTLQAGNALSQDGSAAARAYVSYMSNTIEVVKERCFWLSLRAEGAVPGGTRRRDIPPPE